MFGLGDPDAPIDTDKLRASLTKNEGSVFYVYDDATGKAIISGTTVIGNPTIGIGRLVTGAKGLSDDEQQYLLSNDIRDVIKESENQNWWSHVVNCEPRARACVELMFILGPVHFAAFHKAVAALMIDDFNTAADEFVNSALDHEDGNRITLLAQTIRTGFG